MKLALVEFKFNMKALLNADFHFDWIIFLGLFFCIAHYELFLLGDTIVASIDDYINVVTKTDCYASVAFMLAFDTIKLEIIRRVVPNLAWRF